MTQREHAAIRLMIAQMRLTLDVVFNSYDCGPGRPRGTFNLKKQAAAQAEFDDALLDYVTAPATEAGRSQ